MSSKEAGQRPNEQINVCLFSYPLSKFGGGKDPDVVLHQFLLVLEPLSVNLFFITGNYPESAIFSSKIKLWNVKEFGGGDHPLLIRALDHLFTQVKLSSHLYRLASRIDVVVFVGTTILLLPMFAAWLLRKKCVYVEIGSITEGAGELYRDTTFRSVLNYVIPLFESLHYKLSNRVVVYTRSYITPLLLKYRDKITIAPRHFLDFKKFKPEKPLKDRSSMIGYIGRLDADKCVLDFAEAIPMVLGVKDDVTVLVGGDGQLRDRFEEYVRRKGLSNKVKFVGWISRNEVPMYLNDLKLCVLPSVAEGLPNIMLEAMACGTPFLATPSGGVPDVIKDGKTGFLMEDNSPECIAKNIIRALNHPNLEEIAHDAFILVKNEYTFEAAVERYRKLLNP